MIKNLPSVPSERPCPPPMVQLVIDMTAVHFTRAGGKQRLTREMILESGRGRAHIPAFYVAVYICDRILTQRSIMGANSYSAGELGGYFGLSEKAFTHEALRAGKIIAAHAPEGTSYRIAETLRKTLTDNIRSEQNADATMTATDGFIKPQLPVETVAVEAPVIKKFQLPVFDGTRKIAGLPLLADDLNRQLDLKRVGITDFNTLVNHPFMRGFKQQILWQLMHESPGIYEAGNIDKFVRKSFTVAFDAVCQKATRPGLGKGHPSKATPLDQTLR